MGGINLRHTFFYVSLKNGNIRFCRMPYLFSTLLLLVYSGQHILHQSRQQTFFPAHTFVANNFFMYFLAHPLPGYLMVRS